jgi:hypothetical protein
MASNNKQPTPDASAIEALLPWHAAGALNSRDTREVDAALTRDRQLARTYVAMREECDAAILLNESLGAPSGRALRKLFAAIDAEPRRLPGTIAAAGLCGIATALDARDAGRRCPANDTGLSRSCVCRAGSR